MHKKIISEKEKNKKDMRHIENKKQNSTHKSKETNKNIKCEWINQSNKNSEIVRMDKKQDTTICCI